MEMKLNLNADGSLPKTNRENINYHLILLLHIIIPDDLMDIKVYSTLCYLYIFRYSLLKDDPMFKQDKSSEEDYIQDFFWVDQIMNIIIPKGPEVSNVIDFKNKIH